MRERGDSRRFYERSKSVRRLGAGKGTRVISDSRRAYLEELGKRLVPMSMQELRQRGWKNSRHRGLLCLYFVDGLGESYWLVDPEIRAAGLDKRWPAYTRHDYGIRRINHWRRCRSAEAPA